MNNQILFEDEWLVAVNKRAGQLTVADRWGKEPSENILLHALGASLREKGHKADATGRDLYPVHRLDRDTSGLVLFAKNEAAHRGLSRLFEGREVEKVYWAFVGGDPAWDFCEVNVPLQRLEGKTGRGRAIIHIQNGKLAETQFQVLERFSSNAWIEARPRTGRLHQIRLHLRVLGHPVLNDPLYGWENKKRLQAGERMPLHARSIKFRHPFTNAALAIECPLDETMRAMLTAWKRAKKERD